MFVFRQVKHTQSAKAIFSDRKGGPTLFLKVSVVFISNVTRVPFPARLDPLLDDIKSLVIILQGVMLTFLVLKQEDWSLIQNSAREILN